MGRKYCVKDCRISRDDLLPLQFSMGISIANSYAQKDAAIDKSFSSQLGIMHLICRDVQFSNLHIAIAVG